MNDLRTQLQTLVADRHSPEARALYTTILTYVNRRVKSIGRHAASDLLSTTELDEVVADVLLQLMTGALARFRGGSIPELIGFVRTVTDRRMWRVIRKHVREKRMLEEVGSQAVRAWRQRGPHIDQLVELVPDVPLPQKDEDYLKALLRAGSKAEYARRHDLSRAAVTQRVQRIRKRISALSSNDKIAVDVWLHYAAKQVIVEQASEWG